MVAGVVTRWPRQRWMRRRPEGSLRLATVPASSRGRLECTLRHAEHQRRSTSQGSSKRGLTGSLRPSRSAQLLDQAPQRGYTEIVSATADCSISADRWFGTARRLRPRYSTVLLLHVQYGRENPAVCSKRGQRLKLGDTWTDAHAEEQCFVQPKPFDCFSLKPAWSRQVHHRHRITMLS